MQPSWTVERPIDFHMTDMAGIVHFSQFYRWMEAAEAVFMEAMEIPLVEQKEEEFRGFPRVKSDCRFFAPLTFPGNVFIQISLDALDSRRLHFKFRFFSDSDLEAKPVAEGHLVTIYAGRKTTAGAIESLPLEKDWITRLESALAS